MKSTNLKMWSYITLFLSLACLWVNFGCHMDSYYSRCEHHFICWIKYPRLISILTLRVGWPLCRHMQTSRVYCMKNCNEHFLFQQINSMMFKLSLSTVASSGSMSNFKSTLILLCTSIYLNKQRTMHHMHSTCITYVKLSHKIRYKIWWQHR